MRRTTVSTTLNVLAVAFLAVGTSAVPPRSAELPTKAESQRARVVCRHEIPTGSRIQVTKCQTNAQMARSRAESRAYLKKIQDQAVMGPTPSVRDSMGH